MTKAKIVTPEGQEEIPLEILAEHIEKLANIGALMASSRLKKRTILLLLKDMTGVSMNDIDRVLTALPNLQKEYLKA